MAKLIANISVLEEQTSKLSDNEFPKTKEFKEKLNGGKNLSEILPEAFAVMREASKNKE